MKKWIDVLQYGDRDISSGIDDFWIPRPSKKSIKISTEEQALLMKRLLNNELPFSEKSLAVVKRIMLSRETARGSLYGKTGSGKDIDDIRNNNAGLYVGHVTSGRSRYAFACLVRGEKVSGRDAKALVENILEDSGML